MQDTPREIVSERARRSPPRPNPSPMVALGRVPALAPAANPVGDNPFLTLFGPLR